MPLFRLCADELWDGEMESRTRARLWSRGTSQAA